MFGKTPTRRVTVTRAAGLHARPSLALAKAVQQYQAEVTVRAGTTQADARSVLELLSLGAVQGTELVLSAKGRDADAALDALVQLFADGFGIEDD